MLRRGSSISRSLCVLLLVYLSTLHVPASAIEAYKTTEPWSDFGTIKAIEDADGIESAKELGIAIQSAGDFINISGLDNNETVSFYALNGKALGTAKSIDGNVSFSAKQGTIVVAWIGKENVKIAVELHGMHFAKPLLPICAVFLLM